MKAALLERTTSRPTDLDFARLLAGRNKRIQAFVDKLLIGELTPTEFIDELYQECRDGHVDAYAMGRSRAGVIGGITDADLLLGRGIADEQAEFLQEFLDALEDSDRYRFEDGSFHEGRIRNRSKMYVQRMRGTASEAFVDASDDEAIFDWVLGAVEEHCQDCPDLQAINPWTKNTLFTKPGSGDTQCLVNCKCHLVRVDDGISSFKPVNL